MKKEKLLLILVLVLAAINILSLGFIIMKSEKRNPPPFKIEGNGIEFLKKEFDFNDQQLVEVEQSIHKHRNQFEEKQEKLSDYSMQYYLTNDKTETKDSLLQLILKTTNSIYKINNNHINDIKSLISKDKEEELKRFIEAATRSKQRRPLHK